ncbi:MAG: shikimate dehydrogenase [Isosphaeraceae bacterium]|nr:shikimate dehydrogenase [Isosphaeraceae bacterium]
MSTPRSFKQELVGVFGFPVAENPTQAMIEPAFDAMGLAWRYLTVEVPPEKLADAVRGARAMGWRGFNCTIPHKVAVIEHLDELSPAAEKIGAVNCVIARDGRLIGDNTDGKGFVQSVSAVRPIAGLIAVILGAGGAARAISVELALAGAKHVVIVNRTVDRGETLARQVAERTAATTEFVPWVGDFAIPDSADIVVNATSIGLFPDVSAMPAIDVDSIRPNQLVCDVIPNPPRTPFLEAARSRGCTTLDGLGMLVNQGVIGIRLWTGAEPDPAIMRSSLEAVFGA